MDEFPVSKIEKRIFWGIACAASAMLLSFGLPLLLVKIGIDPKWNIADGLGGGMALGFLLAAGILFCGSVGLIAGLVRPGMQAVAITMGALFLMDICMMGLSMRLYSIAAAIKVACIILIMRTPLVGNERPSPKDDGA